MKTLIKLDFMSEYLVMITNRIGQHKVLNKYNKFVIKITISENKKKDKAAVSCNKEDFDSHLRAGILTGCGQKWGIVQHYEGQLCSKKDQLCGKLCGNQFLISNVLVGC